MSFLKLRLRSTLRNKKVRTAQPPRFDETLTRAPATHPACPCRRRRGRAEASSRGDVVPARAPSPRAARQCAAGRRARRPSIAPGRGGGFASISTRNIRDRLYETSLHVQRLRIEGRLPKVTRKLSGFFITSGMKQQRMPNVTAAATRYRIVEQHTTRTNSLSTSLSTSAKCMSVVRSASLERARPRIISCRVFIAKAPANRR